VRGLPLLAGDDAQRLVGAPLPLRGVGDAHPRAGAGADLFAVDDGADVHLAMQHLADTTDRPLAVAGPDDALAVQLASNADEPLALRGHVEDAANDGGLRFVDGERERRL
jgi:hypothetical protein